MKRNFCVFGLVIFLGITQMGFSQNDHPQPFFKNPQWLSTIRVSGLLQLWAWENRRQWWNTQFTVTYQPRKHKPALFSEMKKEKILTPAEFFYYSHQPEARFYPPEVQRVLDREVGRITQRISISPLEVVDAAIRFYQKYHFRPVVDQQILMQITPRQVRILKILWRSGVLTTAALYQQFVNRYPDEAIAFPLFEKELRTMEELFLVRLNHVGQLQYVFPRVSRAYFHYSVREMFRNLDPVTDKNRYTHIKNLLSIIEE